MARTLDQAKIDHVVKTLEECSGNRSEAARRLNISRRTIQRILARGASAKSSSESATTAGEA